MYLQYTIYDDFAVFNDRMSAHPIKYIAPENAAPILVRFFDAY